MQPQWIRPRYDTRLHVAYPPSPEQVEQARQKHPDAAGALIVSPTPYLTCADISSIARPFHPDLPTWTMDAGADVCVVSVHKMGTGFEQGSVFHRQGDLVDPDQLSACADMLMTTSPNVMVYAALDGKETHDVGTPQSAASPRTAPFCHRHVPGRGPRGSTKACTSVHR